MNVVHYAHALQERFFPQAKLVVIGHTHRQGVWHLPSFTLVNTGALDLSGIAVLLGYMALTARSLLVGMRSWLGRWFWPALILLGLEMLHAAAQLVVGL